MNTIPDNVCEENLHRAFQNEYVRNRIQKYEAIVDYLFSFLSVPDIKKCRLMNKVWRNIGAKILRRRTHVFLDFKSARDIPLPDRQQCYLERYSKLKEVKAYCQKDPPENTPISSFAFGGRIQYFTLINFLDDVQRYMKELKIHSEIYHEVLEEEKMTVDICPQVLAHLTKLDIYLCPDSPVKFNLCFDQIPFVKSISMINCTIVLDTNGKRLSPSDIYLGSENKYIKNGTDINFVVNGSFDLTLTKEINLEGENLILDFSDCANDQVERIVTLRDITVRNWEMCNWKIKKFELVGVPFVERNSIEIEDLATEDSHIDLSKIYNPTSLQSLYCDDGTTIAEGPIFLPSLIFLALATENCVAKLPYFTNNKSISRMWLKSEEDYEDATSVNIDDLPKGLSSLGLHRLGAHGEGVYPLTTLYLEQYDLVDHCPPVAAMFQPKTLQIMVDGMKDEDELKSVIRLLDANLSCEHLIIGDFLWEDANSFNNSVLANVVDKKAEYYAFKGKKGKGLTKREAAMIKDLIVN